MVRKIKKGYFYRNKKLVIHKNLIFYLYNKFFFFFLFNVKNNLFINIILILFTLFIKPKSLILMNLESFKKRYPHINIIYK